MGWADWGLVGRVEERSYIAECIADDSTGGVLLVGPAGVGKTRLAGHGLEDAAEAGWRTVWVSASPTLRDVPYGCVAHLVAGFGDRSGRIDVIMEVVEALAGPASPPRPTLIVVDDADQADVATAAALQIVATTRRAKLLLTVRTEGAGSQLIAGLWKEGLVRRLEVTVLPMADVETLVVQALDGAVDASTVRRLHDWCRGNVLLLRELLTAGLGGESLRNVDATWRWDGPLPVTPLLTGLINDRLRTLSPEERRALELFAVGSPLPVAVAASVAEASALEALERRGLIQASPGSGEATLEISHPLYGEVLAAGLGMIARQRIARELAEAIVRSSAHDADRLRAAILRLDANVPQPAAELVRGARYAFSLFEFGLAERLARAALGAGPSDRAAEIMLAHALYWTDRSQECVDLIDGIGTWSEREYAEAAIVAASAEFWGLGQLVRAEQRLARAIGATTSPDLRGELIAHRSTIRLLSGDPNRGLEDAESVLADPEASSLARARAASAVPASLALIGRTAEVVGRSGELLGLALAHRRELPAAAGEVLTGQVIALLVAGQTANALAVAESIASIGASRLDPDVSGIVETVVGRLRLATGRPRPAAETLQAAIRLLSANDPARATPWSQAALAQAWSQAGAPEEARRALRAATDDWHPAAGLFSLDLHLAQAWVLASEGDLAAGRRCAREGAEASISSGQFGMGLLASAELVRLGGAKDAVGLLEAVGGHVDGELGPLVTRWARAVCSVSGQELGAVAEGLATRGAFLHAADAAAQAVVIYQHQGRRASASAAHEQVLRHISNLGPVRTPALDALVLPRLTQRERQIGRLAAQGHRTKEIAAQLGLSARTVDNHLARVFSKLGITSRARLAEILGEPAV